MDGVHDLGGRQGFGPIALPEKEEPFHEEWEGRMWGLSRGMTSSPDWTLDWFRHVRELIDPADYLTRPYFDQWMQTYAALLIDSGIATVGEVAAGRSATPPPDPGRPKGPETVPSAAKAMARFDRPYAGPHAFAVGARVRGRAMGAPGHTRLPGYARARVGTVVADHGAFVFPDASAHGVERAEPLYSVAFDAADLWPEAGSKRDRVYLDLWESYLEPA